MNDAAAATIIGMLMGGKVETIVRRADGTWEVEMATSRYAIDLLHEHDAMEYCLVDVTNEDEEGHYSEIMLQDVVADGRHVAFEGLYTRPLGERADAEGRFEGRVAFGDPDRRDATLRTMRQHMSTRIVQEQAHQLRYVADGIQNAVHQRTDAACIDAMAAFRTELARLNRLFLNLGGPVPCS